MKLKLKSLLIINLLVLFFLAIVLLEVKDSPQLKCRENASSRSVLLDNRSSLHDRVRDWCPDIINKSMAGHWKYRNYTFHELKEVELSYRRLRSYVLIPPSLQRDDGKCGNVNFVGLMWVRAVCNPKGPTPCCFNNTCVNKTVHECQCPECYDFRPQVLAELADWIPDDPTCKIQYFDTRDKVCEIMQNTTLYFIGNSYQRQLFTSILTLLENNGSVDIFNDSVPAKKKEKCDKYYRYISDCKDHLKLDLTECNNSLMLHSIEIFHANDVLKVLKEHQKIAGKRNSWFIFGFGISDNFRTDHVITKLFQPLLEEASKYEWPKLVYHEPHTLGLLKTGTNPSQQNPSRIAFNLKVNQLMRKHNIPILSFSNMTADAVSYDGSHFGKGVNDMKANILLNYILEQKLLLK